MATIITISLIGRLDFEIRKNHRLFNLLITHKYRRITMRSTLVELFNIILLHTYWPNIHRAITSKTLTRSSSSSQNCPITTLLFDPSSDFWIEPVTLKFWRSFYLIKLILLLMLLPSRMELESVPAGGGELTELTD